MEFRKWNSIENHYQEKTIDRWTSYFPELNDMYFEVTEKIHGANFSILVNTDGSVRFASRGGIIENEDKFYGFRGVFEREEYIRLINELKRISAAWNEDLQLFGELYGGKIQKGVFYGTEKHFKWYALRVRDEIVRPSIVKEMLKTILDFKVPVISLVSSNTDGVLEMIKIVNHEFQSKLTPEDYTDENICEGVVITPYENIVKNQESIFLIKKKGDKFRDKAAKPKVHKVIVLDEEVQVMLDEASLYINENRTNDLQSKMGVFEEMKEISKFAKEYFNDLFIDFEKDNYTEWHNLDKISQGVIKKNIGKRIFQELKESLIR